MTNTTIPDRTAPATLGLDRSFVGTSTALQGGPLEVSVDNAAEIEVLPERLEVEPSTTVFATHLAHPGSRWFDEARLLEVEVFSETFDMARSDVLAEYEFYNRSSLFVVVVDCSNQIPVGCARLILPGDSRLKTFVDAEQLWGVSLESAAKQISVPLTESRTWDVATLSVDPRYRRGTVSLGLYQGICTTARLAGARWLVAGLDVSVLRLLQIRLARGFSPFPGIEPKHYVGSLSTIVWANTADWHARLKERRPRLGEVVFEGASLAPSVQPPDWAASFSQIALRYPS